MMIKYVLPASIECNRSSLIARKIILHAPIRNIYPRLKAILLYPYKLDLNSEANITEECDPKEHIINKESMLAVGDGIKGDMIYCLTKSPIKASVVKPTSGRHKASHISTKDFTYAKLEKSFKSIEGMQKHKLLAI